MPVALWHAGIISLCDSVKSGLYYVTEVTTGLDPKYLFQYNLGLAVIESIAEKSKISMEVFQSKNILYFFIEFVSN